MEYIVIPAKEKEEKDFFMGLLKKMHKEASTLSSEDVEDLLFMSALKESEQSGMGNIENIKSHLSKVTSGK